MLRRDFLTLQDLKNNHDLRLGIVGADTAYKHLLENAIGNVNLFSMADPLPKGEVAWKQFVSQWLEIKQKPRLLLYLIIGYKVRGRRYDATLVGDSECLSLGRLGLAGLISRLKVHFKNMGIHTVDFRGRVKIVRVCTELIFSLRVCTGRIIKNVAESVHYQYGA